MDVGSRKPRGIDQVMTRLRMGWLRPLVGLGWLAGAGLFLEPAMCREAGAQTQGAVATGAANLVQPSPGRTPVLFVPEGFRDPGEYHAPPVFSPDDRKIFFIGRQPVGGESWSPGLRQNPERIWYADRTGNGFGTPGPVGEAVWRHPTHWAFSVASSGNLYFTSHAPEAGEGSDLYLAPFDGFTWGEAGPRIVVPATTTARVVTDGVFSAGEWEGAFRQALGGGFEVYLLADPENLYVGFRFHGEVECTPFSEVYVATGDGRFLNLHSSGSLGEGLNDFPPEGGRTSFSVGTAVGWESNVARTPTRLQGKEYRISRARLPGTTVRLAAFMSMVSPTLRESVSFPQGHGFGSADAWAELVLPPPT